MKIKSNSEDLNYSFLENFYSGLAEKLNHAIDSKFKEALDTWSVNVGNPEHLGRVNVVQVTPLLNHLMIDGFLVMMFSNWDIDTLQPIESLTITASFQCSEITKPEDYDSEEKTGS